VDASGTTAAGVDAGLAEMLGSALGVGLADGEASLLR
jgi:hypothetical protein